MVNTQAVPFSRHNEITDLIDLNLPSRILEVPALAKTFAIANVSKKI